MSSRGFAVGDTFKIIAGWRTGSGAFAHTRLTRRAHVRAAPALSEAATPLAAAPFHPWEALTASDKESDNAPRLRQTGPDILRHRTLPGLR